MRKLYLPLSEMERSQELAKDRDCGWRWGMLQTNRLAREHVKRADSHGSNVINKITQ